MKRLTKEEKAFAARLRAIAVEAEAFEADEWPQDKTGFFTCNRVGEIGSPDRVRYEEAFGLAGYNQVKLWHAKNCMSIRVLLLCFAAAMVETGDL